MSKPKSPGSQPTVKIEPFELSNTSNFDIARLKFCSHCGQLLPQQEETNTQRAEGQS